MSISWQIPIHCIVSYSKEKHDKSKTTAESEISAGTQSMDTMLLGAIESSKSIALPTVDMRRNSSKEPCYSIQSAFSASVTTISLSLTPAATGYLPQPDELTQQMNVKGSVTHFTVHNMIIVRIGKCLSFSLFSQHAKIGLCSINTVLSQILNRVILRTLDFVWRFG